MVALTTFLLLAVVSFVASAKFGSKPTLAVGGGVAVVLAALGAAFVVVPHGAISGGWVGLLLGSMSLIASFSGVLAHRIWARFGRIDRR